MEQDTGKKRKNSKDQFYTKETCAKDCVDKLLPRYSTYQWIEPSAGNGVFLKCLPSTIEKIGVDIDPKADFIQKTDFLEWTPPPTVKKRIFFGNPPFGRQSCLAKAFIKHAAMTADVMAFILPRSFVKPSMSRVFPLSFHCLSSEELPKNSFEVNGIQYDVPCVFQIWEKQITNRVIVDAVQEDGFKYVKCDEPFDISLKRVGGLAGKCKQGEKKDFNPQYHYFIKFEEEYLPFIEWIMDEINGHTFPTNTVGPRSLSKSEVNEVVNDILRRVH